MRLKLLAPLAVFIVICGFLLVGLWRDPREVPSPLIGKPAPSFTLTELHEPAKTLNGTADAAQAAALAARRALSPRPIRVW